MRARPRTRAARGWLGGALLLVLGACRHDAPAPERVGPAASASAPVSAEARWSVVRAGDEAALEEQPARVLSAPESTALVVPAMPARVVHVHVAPGDRVARGAALFDVVMPEADMAAAVQSASSTLVAALERRRDQLKALRSEGLARTGDLFAIEVELARAQGERARAAATLRGLGGDTRTLRSPIEGVVTEVRASVGDWRRPEEGPLARVVDPVARRVEAALAERPPEGASFVLRVPGSADLPLTLRTSVSRTDAEAQGVLAWFDLPAGAQVAPTANARVALLAPAGTLRVPTRAIAEVDGKSVVVKAGDERVEVTVLRTSGAEALVRGALAVGDRITEAPYSRLGAP